MAGAGGRRAGAVVTGAAHELVFGMGPDPAVAPDWPPLSRAELDPVLREVGLGGAADLEWRSPRPLSAACRVRTADGRVVVVKRLPKALRTPEALGEEHAFADHLRANGIPVPVTFGARHGDAAVRGRDFSYEVQSVGVGDDRYGGDFSWTPYLSVDHARAAGRMLARLHVAAHRFDAPPRPARPLLSRLHTFGPGDPISKVADLIRQRPAVATFLAARDWRTDIARVHLPHHRRLAPLLDDLEPLWTHNDWHGTNLLWRGDGPSSRVTAVIDFGLSDRTTAVFDLATAIERSAVDWLAIRGGGAANVRFDQIRALLSGYGEVRKLTAAERRALPLLFPLVHADYELSEIDYFLSVVPGGNPENAEIAYRDYFLGHTAWIDTPAGHSLRNALA
ncbi:MAG: phosphotransferase [Mycobacteriaceae bacterium]|nr:phosphotransferase [Mycobacteriaceae bacterium]